MAAPLPRLRADLDVMPSPLPEQPGLVIRDPFRYSTATLVVPPLLARCLGCFDGRQDEGDLRATLVRLAGRVSVGEAAKNLVKALREAGFLDDERFAELRAARLQEIAASPERPAAHAGGAYPSDAGAADGDAAGLLRRGAARGRRRARPAPVRAIAAPHVSPVRRQRHLCAGLRRAARRSRRARQGVRDPRHLALRRAGSLRADAQAVRDAVRRGADRGRPGRRARPGGAARP